MDACCGPEGSDKYDAVFDERFARAVARRYRRHGLSRAERRIVEFASAVGIDGSSVLEIGGGVGEIQLELLARGATRTANLELAATYETEAARLIEEAGVSGRVHRSVGIDIARQPHLVEAADIVVLHRVVCCYDDVDRLLTAAADHSRRAVVFSYPPSTWLSRTFVALSNLAIRLSGRDYQGFVHSSDAMFRLLRQHGLQLLERRRGVVWNVAGFVRA
jgi:magnesium-protoporphyrin O-methyltransferase